MEAHWRPPKRTAPLHALEPIAPRRRRGIAVGQAPEDDRCWLARLDIEQGTESPWSDIARYRTNRYARTFDGRRWCIAFEHRIDETTILSADAAAPDFYVEKTVEEPGMLVGTAGVHVLSPGQKVAVWRERSAAPATTVAQDAVKTIAK